MSLLEHLPEEGIVITKGGHQIARITPVAEESGLKPKKSAYGILAQYGPGPSEEDIDENRKEMFRGFAEDTV